MLEPAAQKQASLSFRKLTAVKRFFCREPEHAAALNHGKAADRSDRFSLK